MSSHSVPGFVDPIGFVSIANVSFWTLSWAHHIQYMNAHATIPLSLRNLCGRFFTSSSHKLHENRANCDNLHKFSLCAKNRSVDTHPLTTNVAQCSVKWKLIKIEYLCTETLVEPWCNSSSDFYLRGVGKQDHWATALCTI